MTHYTCTVYAAQYTSFYKSLPPFTSNPFFSHFSGNFLHSPGWPWDFNSSYSCFACHHTEPSVRVCVLQRMWSGNRWPCHSLFPNTKFESFPLICASGSSLPLIYLPIYLSAHSSIQPLKLLIHWVLQTHASPWHKKQFNFLYQFQFNREEGWKLTGYLKAYLIIQENTSCCVQSRRTNHKREYGKV